MVDYDILRVLKNDMRYSSWSELSDDDRKICYKKCIHSNNLHENNLASICRFGELVEHLLCLQNFWIRKNRGKMPRIANFPQVMKFRGLDDCFANHFISTNRQCLCFRSRLRLSLTNPE